MSDFSLFSLFTAGLACMIPFTAAYTQPKGPTPKGNPIAQPGLNSVVPAGKPFTVEWQPTTQGTVTLVLLKGPSSDAEPQYPIAENIPNSGTFVWTPKTNLQPSDSSSPAEGYGIQLIVDATGQYQYTTQFGISNPDYHGSSSSSAESAPGYGSHSTSHPPPSYSTPKPPTYGHTTAPAQHTPSNLPKPTWYTPKPSVHNVTMIPPTYSVPSATWSTSAALPTASGNTSAPSPPPYKGGAGSLAASVVSIVLAAGVALFVL